MQHTGAGSGAVSPRRLLLLSLVLGLLLVIHAAGLTLTAQDRSVAPNGTVVVTIAVADAQDLGGIDLVMTYDPAVLRFDSAAPGSLAAGDRVSSNETGPGRIAITVASPGSLTGAGPIVAMTFAAIGPPGTRSTVAIEAVRAVTIDGDPVPAQVVNGTVSIGGSGRTPLSPLAAAGALAVAAASLRRARRSRGRQ